MEKLICITCPIGCHLTVDRSGDEIKVSGASCQRGVEYAKIELTNPRRTITSTVRIENADYNQIPVKTLSPVPKGKIFDVMKILSEVTVKSPVTVGDIIVKNICDTGIDVVATRSL